MNKADISGLIADHFAVPVSQVTDGALFYRDLGADALDMVQLSMLFESRLGVAVADEEVEQCHSVSDAMRLLHTKGAVEPSMELPRLMH